MVDSDIEELKDGYMSDDKNSQKTPNAIDYEKSDEQINVEDIAMEEEKFSAHFSDGAEELLSDGENDGNFSSQDETDLD